MARPTTAGDRRRRRGFTLIELLVVLAIVALLLSLALPRYFRHLEAAKETVLRTNLRETRDLLDKYFADTGRYPDTLDELVAARYLHAVPYDPVTESTQTWVLVPPDDAELGGVRDLHSGATGAAADGTPWSQL